MGYKLQQQSQKHFFIFQSTVYFLNSNYLYISMNLPRTFSILFSLSLRIYVFFFLFQCWWQWRGALPMSFSSRPTKKNRWGRNSLNTAWRASVRIWETSSGAVPKVSYRRVRNSGESPAKSRIRLCSWTFKSISCARRVAFTGHMKLNQGQETIIGLYA